MSRDELWYSLPSSERSTPGVAELSAALICGVGALIAGAGLWALIPALSGALWCYGVRTEHHAQHQTLLRLTGAGLWVGTRPGRMQRVPDDARLVTVGGGLRLEHPRHTRLLSTRQIRGDKEAEKIARIEAGRHDFPAALRAVAEPPEEEPPRSINLQATMDGWTCVVRPPQRYPWRASDSVGCARWMLQGSLLGGIVLVLLPALGLPPHAVIAAAPAALTMSGLGFAIARMAVAMSSWLPERPAPPRTLSLTPTHIVLAPGSGAPWRVALSDAELSVHWWSSVVLSHQLILRDRRSGEAMTITQGIGVPWLHAALSTALAGQGEPDAVPEALRRLQAMTEAKT